MILAATLLALLAGAPAPRPAPAPVAAPAAPPAEADSLFRTVEVGPSQTLSWLAFRQFGAYDETILAALQRDNPSLRDPDLLQTGQKLRFRRSLDRRALPPGDQIERASRKAVATLVRGEVKLVRGGAAPVPLTANAFLRPGDRVITGPGAMAELVIDNQSVLRLRELSILSLVAFQDPTTRGQGRTAGTRVDLAAGRLWTKVRKWAGPLVGFEVRMPRAVAGVHGTIFTTEVAADSSSSVEVVEGVVSVRELREQAHELRLEQGQRVEVGRDGRLGSPNSGRAERGAFESFVEEREELEEQVDGARTEQDGAVERTPEKVNPRDE